MFPIILSILILSTTSNAAVQDFCVADLKAAAGPTGYSCKNPATVTIDDFIFSGFRKPGNTSNTIKTAVTPASADQFPGVNGLGISVARLETEQGGLVPLHSHPGATEIAIVTQGSLVAGFISSANTVYYKSLEEGDTIVFPEGLLHFLFNSGNGTAKAIFSFSSSNPRTQLTSFALFGNDLPSDIVGKVTFLDAEVVKKYKGLLGGSR
ncbi:hypothetical protein J5N97_009394 [Dioscorea zingiberensis]|uniref:Germin-like protein n=1 Tax=Dioscorea zingiberensis TaxID=325984 RepID=A0A9D5HLM3_9LILI|nr:hypothetical protein J5N97_009394 [Dioscorea zingiberensis]